MKKIVFLTAPVSWENKPFKKLRSEKAFHLFSEIGRKNKIQVFFSSPKKLTKNGFEKYWIYSDGQWSLQKKVLKAENIYVFLSFNKNSHEVLKKLSKKKGVKLINDYLFIKLCFDKVALAKFIPQSLHPQTFVVNNKEQLKVAVKKIKTDQIVLKPRYGIRGFGVELCQRIKIKEQSLEDMVVQEFIDMKKVGGRVYDLRLMMVNGKLDHAYHRIAKKGSFKTNCSLGASKKIVKLEDLPGEAWEIASLIDKKVEKFGNRIYSIDLIQDRNNKYYVLELESMPGFYYYSASQAKYRERYLANIFKSLNI